MAKYTIERDTDPMPSMTIGVSREKLIDFIEAGISNAYSGGYDRAEVEADIQPDVLRHLARTTDRIDACTWMARESCGCPMMKAGRVSFGTEGNLPSPIESFVSGYDTAVSNYCSGRSIVDNTAGYTLVVEG